MRPKNFHTYGLNAMQMQEEEQRSQLKLLIARGKEQGYLTFAQVNDHLPPGIVDAEQIEDIVRMLNEMHIPVLEVPPDGDALLLTEESTPATDEEEVEEAAAVLVAVESEFGRTTDPVRMYMREMGNVDLLTVKAKLLLHDVSKKVCSKCFCRLLPTLKTSKRF